MPTIPCCGKYRACARSAAFKSASCGSRSRASNPVLEEARRSGQTIYFVEDGWIVEAAGPHQRRIIEIATVPMTFGGAARFQVANMMAAIAASRALGTGVAQIRNALYSFAPGEHNPVRANLYAVPPGYVLFDYGHNTAALEAIAETAAHWPAEVVTAVLGLPGDRADRLIEMAARAAARGFDRIILREDKDLRGRRPGEVAGLVAKAIRRENPNVEVLTVLDEKEAMQTALAQMSPGELVIAFCDDCDSVREALMQRGAVPVSGVAAIVEGEKVRVA